jgi:GTPase-activating protein SST2
MTRAVGDDDAMVKSLDEVASLFDQAQVSVFKLMASVSLTNPLVLDYKSDKSVKQDSVPKFMREPKYATILRERNLDTALGGSFTVRT